MPPDPPPAHLPRQLESIAGRGQHLAAMAARGLAADGGLGCASLIQDVGGEYHTALIARAPHWRQSLATALDLVKGPQFAAVATGAYLTSVPEDSDPLVAAAAGDTVSYLCLHLACAEHTACQMVEADLYIPSVRGDWRTVGVADATLVALFERALTPMRAAG